MEGKTLAAAYKDCSAHIASMLALPHKQFSSQSLPRACTCRRLPHQTYKICGNLCPRLSGTHRCRLGLFLRPYPLHSGRQFRSKETRAPAFPLNSVSLTHCCCNQTSSTKLRSFCTLNLSQVTTLAVFDSHFSCPYVPPSLASKGPCTNPRLRFCFIPLILGMPSVRIVHWSGTNHRSRLLSPPGRISAGANTCGHFSSP